MRGGRECEMKTMEVNEKQKTCREIDPYICVFDNVCASVLSGDIMKNSVPILKVPRTEPIDERGTGKFSIFC